jgi:starch phosphorylase
MAHMFSMTMCSFRMSSKANAVSVLHKKVSKHVWPAYPMDSITNGIYLPRWDSADGDKALWQLHKENKRKLLAYIAQETGVAWNENTLLFGWGRRLVPYKQPLAFISDIERVIKLATDARRPFRIVFSGPTSEEHESELSQSLQKLIKEKLHDIAVFLPHYSIPISKLMTAGCDVWLNTPMVGSEACGTSGMKAALNGTLSLSTRDGWVAEAAIDKYGWVVHDSDLLTDALLTVVEHEIAPTYYKHLAKPNHSTWHHYMQKSRELIIKAFSMTRALRQYTEECYIPLLHRKHTHKFD